MIKAVIFDMDGTLLNTLSDLTRSTNYALGQMGYPEHTQHEVRGYIGNGVGNLMRRAVPQGAGEENAMRALDIFKEHYGKHSQIDTKPYDGVPQMLQALHEKGYKTAIVSNKFDGAVKELNRAWFGVSVAIGESDTVARKPAPDMVLAALRELGIQPNETVYVGDTEVDLQTAQNSGCLPVLVSWGYRSSSELQALGPYRIAAAPADVLELIK